MGIKITGGDFGGFFDGVMKQASDDAHEKFAQGLAETARVRGLSSADSITIDAKSDSADFPLDAERIRRRANEILANG